MPKSWYKPQTILTEECYCTSSWCVWCCEGLPLLPASLQWPLKSCAFSPSGSGVVILTAKCRHHRRYKPTPFHHLSECSPWRNQAVHWDKWRQTAKERDTVRKRQRGGRDRHRQTVAGQETEREGVRCSDGDSRWEMYIHQEWEMELDTDIETGEKLVESERGERKIERFGV